MIDYLWVYKGLAVHYRPELDGDGSRQAPEFVKYLRQVGHGASLGRAFEWCAGPAFIGFALLREGLIDELVVADVNKRACELVARTIDVNNLHGRVRVYHSDNLQRLPDHETFDLVVSNPPSYYALNPKHHWYNHYKDDLRPNDRGWDLHRQFYGLIGPHLNAGAQLVIQEVEVYSSVVHIPVGNPVAYDIRPEAPARTFSAMINRAGLELLNIEQYYTAPDTGLRMHLMHSAARRRRE